MRPILLGRYSIIRSFYRSINKAKKHFYKLLLNEKNTYEREVLLKKAIKRKNKKFKNRFGNKNSPIHVVFLVQFNRTWAVYDSIYKECQKDRNFKVSIVTIPMKNPRVSNAWLFNEENNNFFKEKKMDFIEGCKKDGADEEWFDLRGLDPDVVFVQNPYDTQRHKIYTTDELNKYTNICYVQYAFIVTSSSFEKHFYGTYFHKNCWKLFAETDFHKKLYKKYASNIENRVVVSGYPKLDFYNDESKDVDNIWKISRKKNKNIKRVIWTPHWTINDLHLKASNFLKYYKYFLELAKDNKNIELVFRPHQSLFDELLEKNHMSRRELGEYKDSINNLPNAQIDENVEYFGLFRTSDLLITDNSSFLAEYLPTENPIIYTHSYDNDQHNLSEYGQQLTKYHYIARNKNELNNLIKKIAIEDDDYEKNNRISNMKENIYFPDNGSGYLIKENIKKSFGL